MLKKTNFHLKEALKHLEEQFFKLTQDFYKDGVEVTFARVAYIAAHHTFTVLSPEENVEFGKLTLKDIHTHLKIHCCPGGF